MMNNDGAFASPRSSANTAAIAISLKDLLSQPTKIFVVLPFQGLAGCKVIPPPAFPPNGPDTYGAITQSGVSEAEINAPHRKRAFCMAITNEDVSGEVPSSWSAALDQICAGSMQGEDAHANERRLFFVSAGNIRDTALPDEVEVPGEFPIEDPAQSWNAVSVGGFTNKSEIHQDETDYFEWTPFAEAGSLSPFSRVSTDWEHSRTPIKPEIVFEAGNRALSPNESELLSGLSSLSSNNCEGFPRRAANDFLGHQPGYSTGCRNGRPTHVCR